MYQFDEFSERSCLMNNYRQFKYPIFCWVFIFSLLMASSINVYASNNASIIPAAENNQLATPTSIFENSSIRRFNQSTIIRP